MSDYYTNEGIKGKVLYLLIESDWTQEPNVNLSVPELEAWDKYRQDLRDFPEEIYQEELATGQCAENPIWPKKPEE
jgi:hypothetical protein